VTPRRIRPKGSTWLDVRRDCAPGSWTWSIVHRGVNGGWFWFVRQGTAPDGRTALSHGLMSLAEPTPIVPREVQR
jgi:hypothetical protein